MRRLLPLVAALLVACAVLPAAAGAATKPYSVAIAPPSVAAGAQVTFKATFTNLSSQQALGSADLTAPTALTVVSASVSPGDATVAGNVIRLRNLSLAPGTARTVTIIARAGCSSGLHTWKVVAKQANDFNGTPGNDFTLDASQSSLTTTISGGGCLVVRCDEDTACSGTLGPLSVTAFASPTQPDSGFLVLSLNAGPPLDCDGYEELAADWVTLDVTAASRSKRAVFEIPKQRMNELPTNGTSFLQMCFGAPYTFPTKPGTPLVARDYDGGGVDEYVGLLPDCSGPVTSPCVSQRKRTNAGDALIFIEQPPSALDPRYHG